MELLWTFLYTRSVFCLQPAPLRLNFLSFLVLICVRITHVCSNYHVREKFLCASASHLSMKIFSTMNFFSFVYLQKSHISQCSYSWGFKGLIANYLRIKWKEVCVKEQKHDPFEYWRLCLHTIDCLYIKILAI